MFATRLTLTVLASVILMAILAGCQDAQTNNGTSEPTTTIITEKPKPQPQPADPKPSKPKPIDTGKTKPITSSPKTSAKTGPVLTVEKDTHDFGKSGPSKRLKCEYKFKNTGTSDLTITNIQITCGCTEPDDYRRKKAGKILRLVQTR